MVAALLLLFAAAVAVPARATTHAPPPWSSRVYARVARAVAMQELEQRPWPRQWPRQWPWPSSPLAPGPTGMPTESPEVAARLQQPSNRVEDSVKENPSNCVWAIVTCCQAQTSTVRYPCFELLNCKGAFWDNSPCEPAMLHAALAQVSKFYSKKEKT